MLEVLKTWTVHIVTVMIFITFLEILIPNNSMNGYVRIVIGLLIMFAIMQPLIKLTNGEIKFEEEIFKASESFTENTLSFDINKLQASQNEQLVSLYKSKIEKNIQDRIESYHYIQVISIKSEIEEDMQKNIFGSIKSLNIVLDKNSTANNIERIRKDIAILYGIDENFINLTVKDKGV